MSGEFPSLVSTEWLAVHLHDPNTVIVDASRHLPAAQRDARCEYETAHIPGARFLDLANLTDTHSQVPAAVPSPEQLAQKLSELGIEPDHNIVLYDDSAVRSSARAWFILSAYGLENVAVLDGGLGKWRAENRPLESDPDETGPVETTQLPPIQNVRSKSDMLANLNAQSEQVLDARAADRVFGTGIDPVHGGQNGRIPGSFNLPFDQLFQPDGTYKSIKDLKSAFEAAGIDLNRPIVTSCGSGITASVLLFALHLIGKIDIALYDGSWMEWEADPNTPKAQGPKEERA